MFQHTAARRRLGAGRLKFRRPILFQHTAARRRLVSATFTSTAFTTRFNTQPPEGGWEILPPLTPSLMVSTHSRPKAAGQRIQQKYGFFQCFNTQPPEGGWYTTHSKCLHNIVFQHTAARRRLASQMFVLMTNDCFNTQPPEGGWFDIRFLFHRFIVFQHTAARRRLVKRPDGKRHGTGFQHTAARRRLVLSTRYNTFIDCFNTQPPEGGWLVRLLLMR